jgi:hypothetical protein
LRTTPFDVDVTRNVVDDVDVGWLDDSDGEEKEEDRDEELDEVRRC